MKLLHHPYTPPKVRLGEPVEAIIYYRDSNEVEARQVLVTGWSSGRIKWPIGPSNDGVKPSVSAGTRLARKRCGPKQRKSGLRRSREGRVPRCRM